MVVDVGLRPGLSFGLRLKHSVTGPGRSSLRRESGTVTSPYLDERAAKEFDEHVVLVCVRVCVCARVCQEESSDRVQRLLHAVVSHGSHRLLRGGR